MKQGEFYSTLYKGLLAAFMWGALVAMASKVEVRRYHAPAEAVWFSERGYVAQ